MVTTCSAIGCANRHNPTNKGISFHRFPIDPTLRTRWILAVRRKNWFPSRHSRICSSHFVESDLERTDTCVKLKKDVVPSVFNFFPSKKGTCKKLDSDVVLEKPEQPSKSKVGSLPLCTNSILSPVLILQQDPSSSTHFKSGKIQKKICNTKPLNHQLEVSLKEEFILPDSLKSLSSVSSISKSLHVCLKKEPTVILESSIDNNAICLLQQYNTPSNVGTTSKHQDSPQVSKKSLNSLSSGNSTIKTLEACTNKESTMPLEMKIKDSVLQKKSQPIRRNSTQEALPLKELAPQQYSMSAPPTLESAAFLDIDFKHSVLPQQIPSVEEKISEQHAPPPTKVSPQHISPSLSPKIHTKENSGVPLIMYVTKKSDLQYDSQSKENYEKKCNQLQDRIKKLEKELKRAHAANKKKNDQIRKMHCLLLAIRQNKKRGKHIHKITKE